MTNDFQGNEGWYFGPSVIALDALSKKLGHSMDWFDRVASSAIFDALPEKLYPNDFKKLHEAIQSRLSPGQWSRFWGKDSFRHAPTVWTICAEASTF